MHNFILKVCESIDPRHSFIVRSLGDLVDGREGEGWIQRLRVKYSVDRTRTRTCNHAFSGLELTQRNLVDRGRVKVDSGQVTVEYPLDHGQARLHPCPCCHTLSCKYTYGLMITMERAHYSPPWADTSIIGIAGSSGSGKSTLAHKIVGSLNLPWVAILSMVYGNLPRFETVPY